MSTTGGYHDSPKMSDTPRGPVELLMKATAGVILLMAGVTFIAYIISAIRTHAAEFSDLSITAAPFAHAESVPWNPKLPDSSVDGFDVSPDGYLVLSINGMLYDAATGKPLTDFTGNSIGSVAFVDGSVVGITFDMNIGYLNEQGFQIVGVAPFISRRIQGMTDGRGAFLMQDLTPFGLAVVHPDGSTEALTGAADKIIAVAGTESRHVFAVGDELYVQDGTSTPLLLLKTGDKEITGVALDSGAIYFSTIKGIYIVHGAVALPVVLGLGGSLRMYNHSLVVLNAANNRIYRVTLGST